MSLTYELAFVDEAVLERLDDHDDARIASVMFEEGYPRITLGRAWHMIHTLLTGTPDRASGPLSFMLGGGRAIGSPDPNGGWTCAFTAGEVAAIHAALPSAEELVKRYEMHGMPAEVAYASRLKEAGAEYFLEVYRDLLDATRKAVEGEQGMLAGLI